MRCKPDHKQRALDIQSDFNEVFILLRKLGVLFSTSRSDWSNWYDAIDRWRNDGGR